MSAGRKRVTPRARHVTHQDPPHVPGAGVDGLNTKLGRQREKAAQTAAKKAAKARREARGERAESEET